MRVESLARTRITLGRVLRRHGKAWRVFPRCGETRERFHRSSALDQRNLAAANASICSRSEYSGSFGRGWHGDISPKGSRGESDGFIGVGVSARVRAEHRTPHVLTSHSVRRAISRPRGRPTPGARNRPFR